MSNLHHFFAEARVLYSYTIFQSEVLKKRIPNDNIDTLVPRPQNIILSPYLAFRAWIRFLPKNQFRAKNTAAAKLSMPPKVY